jgi:hypothetical protein
MYAMLKLLGDKSSFSFDPEDMMSIEEVQAMMQSKPSAKFDLE